MTPEERAAVKLQFPDHWFVRVVKDGWSALVAIPRLPGPVDPPITSLPGLGMTLSMLHGATITRTS